MPSPPKILIADESDSFLHAISPLLENAGYNIQTAKTGTECLQKITSFAPDLFIVDLMLPQNHGIELIEFAKKNHIRGAILLSAAPMLQNYHGALDAGADYFLVKPFSHETLLQLIKTFFAGTLKPLPFEKTHLPESNKTPHYTSHRDVSASYLKFWGTRGSSPVSGKEYIRFGGNSPCLEVRAGNDLVIIDAGTGIRALGKALTQSFFKKIHIVLGHTHWDHIAGFPFFLPIYHKEYEIHIWAPVGYGPTTRVLFSDKLSYSFFPVKFEDIAAQVIFHDLHDGDHLNFGTIAIQTSYAFHPGPTLCFKINCGGKTFGYVTDNEFLIGYHGDPKQIDPSDPQLAPYARQLQFLKGCDTLIHEAQYLPSEYLKKVGWGHSSVTNSALLVKLSKTTEWIVTHHDPKHTDEDLQKKLQLHREVLHHLESPCRVTFAFDEFTIPL